MKNKIGVAILAAGEGKRLKCNIAKGLLPLLGRKMIDFPIGESLRFCKDGQLEGHWGIVIGHLKEKVKFYLQEKYDSTGLPLSFAVQESPRGTADALKAYFDQIPQAKETLYTLVMCADVPLIRSADLTQMFEVLKSKPSLNAVAATFEVDDPTGYGRIVLGDRGLHIVEEKHTDDKTRKIKEVNASLYFFRTTFLLQQLQKIKVNPTTGEFYLTDVFEDQFEVQAFSFGRSQRFLGVNTLRQLDEVTQILRKEKNASLQDQGVLLLDAQTTYVDWDVQVKPGTIVSPQVHLQGNTRIDAGVTLETGSIVRDSNIGGNTVIKAYSYIDQSSIHGNAEIGPFARIRPGAEIGEKAKVGNFVEIKKSKIDREVKISHLSYVGDAEIGEGTNIGCGFITCNFDGVQKHKTVIGKNTFIGSDCQVVAPLEIGDEAYVASGSTLNRPIPSGAFAIARSRQETKEGMAKRFLKKKNPLDAKG